MISVATIIAGAFICVAGTYVSIKVSSFMSYLLPTRLKTDILQLIVDAYRDGIVGKPFTC